VSARRRGGGALAIVLHTHMPYVEGFGTWPFGEEWLWEAFAGCYLPLLDLLDEGAPLTLSLTPVLCDQLEVPGLAARFYEFVEQVRRDTLAADAAGLRAGGHEQLAAELERAWGDYERAAESLRRRGGELLAAFAPHAAWTSAATHAVLPLLATEAGVREQVRSGVRSHLRRFGESWRGGFWLPECAYAPELEPLLVRAGVRASCVELTGLFGLGAREHLRPLVGPSGLLLVPIDRASIDLVWGERGYPANGVYRDYHRSTIHNHHPWRNDGGAYDFEVATALAQRHAADFVERVGARLARDGRGLPGGGLIVCAVDTELFGHWWYEGPTWLRAVVEECSRQGVELTPLDEALARIEPEQLGSEAAEWAPSSWGEHGDLSTWSTSCRAVAAMAFETRASELRLLRAGRRAGATALRELLALQSSDWAFMLTRELAAPYAHERFDGHRLALEEALERGPGAPTESLRELASHAEPALLFEP